MDIGSNRIAIVENANIVPVKLHIRIVTSSSSKRYIVYIAPKEREREVNVVCLSTATIQQK